MARSSILLKNKIWIFLTEDVAGRLEKFAFRNRVRKFQAEGNVKDRKRSERKRVTSKQDERMMIRAVMKDRCRGSQDIAADLNESGVRVSARTVRRRLWQAGLKAKTPRKKPFLNFTQRQKRVAWAKEHQDWTVDNWKKVLFSDESRICIFGQDGIKYVRRRVGEENRPDCCIPTMKHPVSVMIWGCMARDGIGRLQVMQGNVNARQYIDTVLERKLFQSARDIFGQENPDFIFQQDGAPCHTAKICKNWFVEKGVNVLEWPGNSPDLNPIENLWSRLKRLVSAKRPSNKNALIAAIVECWFHVITQEDLQRLVDSMPRRCKAVIAASGYPTKY
jgi:hypothetical protein